MASEAPRLDCDSAEPEDVITTLSVVVKRLSADVKICILESVVCPRLEETCVGPGGAAPPSEALVGEICGLLVAGPTAVLEDMLADGLFEIDGE